MKAIKIVLHDGSYYISKADPLSEEGLEEMYREVETQMGQSLDDDHTIALLDRQNAVLALSGGMVSIVRENGDWWCFAVRDVQAIGVISRDSPPSPPPPVETHS